MNHPTRFSIHVSMTKSDVAIGTVRLVGEFDRLQVDRFEHRMGRLPEGLHAVTVDLTATTLIDSAALGSLIRLRRAFDGDRFRVLVSTTFQKKVMSVSGLEDLLGVEHV